ncbi:DUF2799 domain-containing protein [Motilimonas sp. KMU-193]|uniref:DUF2799 domain-containing protein n=1 Tax=Motilimonas sp. KMU-193 TaxID=3388668 RepID=UPI00396B48B3
MKIFFVIFTILVISACASSSEDMGLVKSSNWSEIGRNDAANGSHKKSISQLEELNDKYMGSEVDYQAYLEGYDTGLGSYCTLDNAYLLGYEGKMYNGICDELESGKKFRERYEDAKRASEDF